MGVCFINDVIGGTAARFTGRKEMLTVELHILDVVQWRVPRADLLHALGKFTDVVVIATNVCVVLIYKAAHPISLPPIRVNNPDAPAVREVEQCFTIL